jgi:hypothetical protein
MSAAIYGSTPHVRTQNFPLMGAYREAIYILSWNLKTVLQNLTAQTTVCNYIYMHINIIGTSKSITQFKSHGLIRVGGGCSPAPLQTPFFGLSPESVS